MGVHIWQRVRGSEGNVMRMYSMVHSLECLLCFLHMNLMVLMLRHLFDSPIFAHPGDVS